MSAFQETISEGEKAVMLRYLSMAPTANSKEITPSMASQGVFPMRWLVNLVYRHEPYSLLPNDERAMAVATAIRILTEMGVMRVIGVDESRERFNHRRADEGALYQIISLDPLLPAAVGGFVYPERFVPELAPAGTPVTHWRSIPTMPGWESGHTDTMQLIDGAVRQVPGASAAAA